MKPTEETIAKAFAVAEQILSEPGRVASHEEQELIDGALAADHLPRRGTLLHALRRGYVARHAAERIERWNKLSPLTRASFRAAEQTYDARLLALAREMAAQELGETPDHQPPATLVALARELTTVDAGALPKVFENDNNPQPEAGGAR